MRKFTLLISAAFIAITSGAQTVADFESLTLPGTDTAYVNYSAPGTDVGFNNGLAHFPCVYDTGFGSGYWYSIAIYKLRGLIAYKFYLIAICAFKIRFQ